MLAQPAPGLLLLLLPAGRTGGEGGHARVARIGDYDINGCGMARDRSGADAADVGAAWTRSRWSRETARSGRRCQAKELVPAVAAVNGRAGSLAVSRDAAEMQVRADGR